MGFRAPDDLQANAIWGLEDHTALRRDVALEERSFAGRANNLALLSTFLAMQVGELPGCALGMPENF